VRELKDAYWMILRNITGVGAEMSADDVWELVHRPSSDSQRAEFIGKLSASALNKLFLDGDKMDLRT
jgi:hypothetical protein